MGEKMDGWMDEWMSGWVDEGLTTILTGARSTLGNGIHVGGHLRRKGRGLPKAEGAVFRKTVLALLPGNPLGVTH